MKMLTPDTYVAQSGLICPHCGSPEVRWATEMPALIGDRSWWLMKRTCDVCGFRWSDRLELTGFEYAALDVPKSPPIQVTVYNGHATLPNGQVVNLLAIQESLNNSFQETGEARYGELSDELSKITGMWQGPHCQWLSNGVPR